MLVLIKRLFSFLFSTKFMAFLIIVFCMSMGVATFIENDFGTPAARSLIFEATWFEMIIALLGVNFAGNIKKYRLWRKEMLPVLTFHLALILIIIGAAISRFIAFEGVMHIREGKSSNLIVTDKVYLQASTSDQYLEKEVNLTPITNNNFEWDIEIENQPVKINFVRFIPHAIEYYEQSDQQSHGVNVLHIVASANTTGRTDFYIRKGDILNVFGTTISYDLPGIGAIQIMGDSTDLKIIPHHDISYMKMSDQSRGIAHQDSANVLEQRALYLHEGMSFVVKEIIENAVMKIAPSDKEEDKNREDVLVVNVSSDNFQKEVVLSGKKGIISPKKEVILGNTSVLLRYGSKTLKTPFHIRLNDFELERYPGSQSPASYASKVTIIDDKQFDFHIFMNNVLDYKGYRFFQASYDNDELGTVLSVNHDRLGTSVTYIGYALMTIGMLMTLFWKGTRFRQITIGLAKKSLSVITLCILVSLGTTGYSQHGENVKLDIDSLLMARNIDTDHAQKFGKLVVQDEGGRLKPLNTVASEVLRKLYNNNTYEGLSADQVFLGMHTDPMMWSFVPIIRITTGKHNIQHLIPLKGKYARYVDFFDAEGNYLLANDTEKVMKKREAERNDTDKLLLEISQRVTLLYELFNGKLLRIFPLPYNPDNKWYSHTDINAGFKGEDSTFVYNIPYIYFRDVVKASTTADWSVANQKLIYFDKYQRRYGSEVIPSNTKIKLEILYNKYEIFNKLYKFYGIIGLVMLLLLLVQLVKPSLSLKSIILLGTGAIVVMYVLHTTGLAVRWYVSGHAPWSNAYESMVYVAWSTVLVGLFFIKKSKITLSATAIMAAMFLMVAHWNWVDPEIGNLVPVLNSYWLMIHVAIIVASYGPFTLAFLLGIIVMVMYIMQTESNYSILKTQINRLSHINEITITIGVFLLAIGTFLGGVWANESWGRYWSWDPKETWALVSIMVYALVLHLRHIPGLRGRFAFNFAAILSYSSIMMTYFGVNYYLAGMHSYAKGDPVPIPSMVYYTVAFIAVIALLAYRKKREKERKIAVR